MSDETKQNSADGAQGTVFLSGASGTVASHAARPVQPVLVAPTTGTDFNVVSLDLVPVACLGLHDVLFDFDSSFVTPRIGEILRELPGLRTRHKKNGQARQFS